MAGERPDRHQRRSALHMRRAEAGKRSRLGRTIVLGALAVGLALVWLAREMDLDRDELLGYLGTSALFVGILITLSLMGAVVVRLLKRLRRGVRSR